MSDPYTEPETLTCNVCSNLCEGGYSQDYKGNEVVRTLCFTCREREDLEVIQLGIGNDNLVLTSKLLTFGPMIQCHSAYHDVQDFKLKDEETWLLYHTLVQHRGKTWRNPVTPNVATSMYFLLAQIGEVSAAVTLLDTQMWLDKLQKVVQACEWKGMSCEYEGYKYLHYCICGRAQLTITDPEGYWINVITVEDDAEPRMGIQGIYASKDKAVEILDTARRAWGAGMLDFQPDKEVGIL